DRRIKQEAIEQVQYAADAREEVARILHASFAFEERLDQIPNDRRDAKNHPENDSVQISHAAHLLMPELKKDHTRERRDNNRPSKPLPRFARADARNHFVLPDQGAYGISACVAELGDEHEVKEIIMAIHARKEIDLLNEIQQPRHIHQAEQRRRNRQNSGGIAFRKELPSAKPQDEQDQEAGLKIVDSGGRTGCA